jgi:RNA polymerase sigma-70 factor (ECF subfamily)
VLLVHKGDEKAFNELYHRYSKRMLFFFYTRLYQNEQKAQDCLQDLFVKILDKLDTFDTNQRFSSWVYAIASNMCKNEYRKNERSWKEDPNFDWTQLIDSKAVGSFDSELDKRLFIDSLQELLSKVSEENRMIFLLRHQDGLTIPEISNVVNCPEGTVKSKLFYMTKKLYVKLKVFSG